jgi:hypothetical protein
MKSRQILTTVALMILSFTATLAVLWHQRVPPPAAASPRNSWRTAALPAQRPPADAIDAPVSAARSTPLKAVSTRAPAAPSSPIEAPVWDDTGPPLPVLFAVSSHASLRQNDAEDDDAESDQAEQATPTVQPDVARQVDVLNESGEPLSITVLSVDVPTQETTQAQLLVPPHAQAHAGSESGLKLEPGYQVTLRSRGYQEMTQTVP